MITCYLPAGTRGWEACNGRSLGHVLCPAVWPCLPPTAWARCPPLLPHRAPHPDASECDPRRLRGSRAPSPALPASQAPYPAMCAPGVQRHLHHPAHDQGHARPDQELDPRAHHAHERSLRPVRRCTRAAFHCLPACTFQSARLSWMPEEHSRPTAHSAGTASSAQETARRTVGRCGTGASWAFTR